MTNAKTLKRTLFSSVISLLLCFTMLLGTTFAWFTDSVTSSGNIIKSGTLDVEMYWADGKADPAADTTVWTDASNGAIFNNDKWEPGYTEVRHIKIANEGTLALKYMVEIVPEGTVSELAEVIDVYYADPALQVADGDALTDAMKLGTLKDVLANLATTGSGTLAAQTADTITIAFKMQESAGNLYQDKSIGTSFAVQVLATQVEAEEDSFGPDYDKDAEYPEVKIENVMKEEGVAANVTADTIGVDIPDTAPAGNYTLEVADMVETTDANGNTVASMDITLKNNGVKVADGSATYRVSIDIGVGKTIVGVTHNGEAVTVYDYNQATGILTFETDSFSPFTCTYYDDLTYGKVAKVGDVYYATFDEAYAAANKGDTIVLVNDVVTFAPSISKAITLDLGGKTITDAYIKISADVTLQNGSIKNVNEPYPVVVSSGALTIEDVALEASKSDRAIWLNGSSAVLNFNSGSLLATKGENNTKSSIYGVWVDSGAVVNMNGGTIEVDAGPTARGIAIFGNYTNNEVNINGGKISTSGTTYSYAIWVDGNVNISGGEIVTNEKLYGYTSGITYGKNYAIHTKGDVTITGGKITTNGPSGYLVNAGGSAQKVIISDVEYVCVLSEIDRTKGGHSDPQMIYGSATVEITGGEFYGVNAQLAKDGATVTVRGGTFDVAINAEYVADGATLTDNGDGSWSVK